MFWLFFMAKDGTNFNKICIEKERSGAGHLPCWDGFLSCTSRCSSAPKIHVEGQYQGGGGGGSKRLILWLVSWVFAWDVRILG